MNEGQLDFSVREMPQAWLDASAEAPQPDETPVVKKVRKLKGRSHVEMDYLGAVLGAIATSVVAGATWYYLDTDGAWSSPWAPIGLGIIMGLGVRLGGGKPEPSQRASIAVSWYLMTITVVLYALHRASVLSYLPDAGWTDIERSIVRGYLRDSQNALGLMIGGIAAAGINLGTKLRS
jgi:hypothetical protein